MQGFLCEGQRCNFNDFRNVRPFQTKHEEPTMEEMEDGFLLAQKIATIFLEAAYSICGQIFNYRVHSTDGFIQNLYEFFFILIHNKMQLYYSPNYGCSFWPKQLGFFQLKKVQQIFEKENEKFLHIFFSDYTHETTTFLRYHHHCRYNSLFSGAFKKLFLKGMIESLIVFGNSIGRGNLVRSCIHSALQLLYIRRLAN